jgi:sterol desaturase/sphingolipid hydroxylase (fatty acid hydroxylase superfamily)
MASGAVQRVIIKMVLAPLIGMGPYIAVYHFGKRHGFHPLLDPTADDADLTDANEASMWRWYASHFMFALVMDFCYYWLHRSSHTTFLWLGHSVHHDSDRYNLSTALRQGILQAGTGFVFYLPLALIIPPRLYLTHAAIKCVSALRFFLTALKNVSGGSVVLVLLFTKIVRMSHCVHVYSPPVIMYGTLTLPPHSLTTHHTSTHSQMPALCINFGCTPP